jgi:hypothetical protein
MYLLFFFYALLFWFNMLVCTFQADGEQVKRIHVATRENPIVNRLNKTKVEKFPDLREEKEQRLSELRKRDQSTQQARVSLSCSPVSTLCPSVPTGSLVLPLSYVQDG